MIECNSIEHNSVERSNRYPTLNATLMNEISLSDRQHFRLNKINEIKDYFVAEIKERELMSKNLANILLFVIILITFKLFYQQQAVVFL